MAIYYRGAGVRTYWHENDAQILGFTAKAPDVEHTLDRLMLHVARMDINSPYISLTKSYGVAYTYALFFGHARPYKRTPAYIYEIEFDNPLPNTVALLDPVKEVATGSGSAPSEIRYHHDGDGNFLLGVFDYLWLLVCSD